MILTVLFIIVFKGTVLTSKDKAQHGYNLNDTNRFLLIRVLKMTLLRNHDKVQNDYMLLTICIVHNSIQSDSIKKP